MDGVWITSVLCAIHTGVIGVCSPRKIYFLRVFLRCYGRQKFMAVTVYIYYTLSHKVPYFPQSATGSY